MVTLLFLLALASLAGAVALLASERTSSGAKARRAWAREHGFGFTRSDELLSAEWKRGAASAGAVARSVASGTAYGHDAYVADLGEATVVAMGTGAESDVVVDFRRAGFRPDAAGEASEDLVAVGEEQGFACFTTHPGPALRFVDTRVRTALDQLPAAVRAVWFEGAWAIAELTPGAEAADLDATLAPLALLADAARTLPPRDAPALELPYLRGPAPAREETVEQPAPEEPELVARPEEPIELPTRSTGGARGEVEERALGTDDVEPIGGEEHRTDLTRVRRTQKPSSIFEEEL